MIALCKLTLLLVYIKLIAEAPTLSADLEAEGALAELEQIMKPSRQRKDLICMALLPL